MKLEYGTSRLTECCRTRKKVIPTANQKQENITIHKGPNGIQSNNKQNFLKREKTAGDQHVDGFSFALDWMAGRCNFFRLIVEGGKLKPKQN